ncbi:MAG: hydrogenase nickel incorporation protein HypB [Lachnospiraceae bacterium]|nr:hydrogenase nickel incorporation protein HypB [Lachnospiraceae bacterium]
MPEVIELNKSITASNDRDADLLRKDLKDKGIMLINLMSSPGSGKTTLLMQTIADMKKRSGSSSIAVLEADIASDVDAALIEKSGAVTLQAHTDGMCHMDAGMTRRGMESMDLDGIDLVFLENVGNLICPAEFDTGAHKNVMVLSIPEGDDKPLKYPLMFATSDVLIITKTDTCDYFSFNTALCIDRVKRLNPDIIIFPLSAKTGEGMDLWEEWLESELKAFNLC